MISCCSCLVLKKSVSSINFKCTCRDLVTVIFRVLFWILPFPTCVMTLDVQCIPQELVKNKQTQAYSGGTWTHDLLLSSADVLTTQPLNLPVVTGWFEYIEQWVLQTIFQRWFFGQNPKLITISPTQKTSLEILPAVSTALCTQTSELLPTSSVVKSLRRLH